MNMNQEKITVLIPCFLMYTFIFAAYKLEFVLIPQAIPVT